MVFNSFRDKITRYFISNTVFVVSVAEQVRQVFQRLRPGGVTASAELHRLSADSRQVDKAVSRLYKKEGLQKMRNGLYCKPDSSKYFGELPPKADAIINLLRKQYRARIVPSGPLAAYQLGFTGTPPEQRVYDSDKRIGEIELENDLLRFRTVVGKKLNVAGQEVTTLLNALAFFFRENPHLNYLQEQHVKRLLARHDVSKIRRGLTARPRWLRDRVEAILSVLKGPVYITGISALNVPYRGRVGDWHQSGLLASQKFQVAGSNYHSAPGLASRELFDCSEFLQQHGIELETKLCAKPERAVKDLLYSNIIVKNRYPSFFMKDEYLLPLSDPVLRNCVNQLLPLANTRQQKYLERWLEENEIH